MDQQDLPLRPVTNAYAPDAKFEPSRLARLTHDLRDPLSYLYCVCCERAYERGYSRRVDGRQLCPFDGCDGDAMEDAWSWVAIARAHPACYPRIPKIGEVYPMFGTSGDGARAA
jgi:hypothetical protein